MRVESIVFSDGNGPQSVRVSASFASRRRPQRKEILWFEFPESFAEKISRTAEPWLQALLPLAMRWGEPLEIDAPVDEIWLRNAQETMRLWSRWYPKLKPVEIKTSGVRQRDLNSGNRGLGLFFTAGVDSFYSLLFHDQSAAAANTKPVDHLIYVCGYDIPLAHETALQEKIKALDRVARRLNRKLIPVRTNLRETRLGELDWGAVMHGPALGTVGLLLESQLETVLISAGGDIDDATPWGSHPLSDPLMSTNELRFIRYQNKVNRFQKTEFIAKSQIALDHLHVCWIRKAHDNCGACEKCVRTMLMLEVIGVLDKASCFPPGSIMEKVKSIQVTNALAVPLWEEVKAPARAAGREDIVRAIDLCLARSAPVIAANANPGLLRRWERKVRHARKALFR
jgi:hypothetical protein